MDGYNSIHLNDNGMSASCFSQHTLTLGIITTERVISLLWYTAHRKWSSLQKIVQECPMTFSMALNSLRFSYAKPVFN